MLDSEGKSVFPLSWTDVNDFDQKLGKLRLQGNIYFFPCPKDLLCLCHSSDVTFWYLSVYKAVH